MPAPTVSVLAPPPTKFSDPGVLRPNALIAWTGGVGPFDVLHEWDTDNLFGSPIQDLNTGATSPDTGVPPSDMGPAGTTWYYRATVTDTSDSTSTTTPTATFSWVAAIDHRRYLYQLGNLGVGFDPIDTPAGGWGPAAGSAPGDGYAIDFRRYLYQLANIDTTTPTPHIWYVFPNYGREGWEFKVIGYGFGDTQGTYSGQVRLNALGAGVVSWVAVADTAADPKIINHELDIATPIHQEIRAIVPVGAVSGLVYVDTDGP